MKEFWKKTWMIVCTLVLGATRFLIGCKEKTHSQSDSQTSESIEESSNILQESSEEGTDDFEESESGSSNESESSSTNGTWTGTYLPT